jgi:hypothetical protein
MKSYLNYVWIFIWNMYFKVLELCMDFYLKHEFFLIYFKIPYDFTIQFYDPSLFSTFRAVSKSWF